MNRRPSSQYQLSNLFFSSNMAGGIGREDLDNIGAKTVPLRPVLRICVSLVPLLGPRPLPLVTLDCITSASCFRPLTLSVSYDVLPFSADGILPEGSDLVETARKGERVFFSYRFTFLEVTVWWVGPLSKWAEVTSLAV